MRKTIPFSKDLNNKTSCDSFTTIRMYTEHNQKYYQVGELYDVTVGRSLAPIQCQVEIIDIKIIKNLEAINEWIARLESGTSKQEYTNRIQSRYKQYNLNFNTQKWMWILMAKVDIDINTQENQSTNK